MMYMEFYRDLCDLNFYWTQSYSLCIGCIINVSNRACFQITDNDEKTIRFFVSNVNQTIVFLTDKKWDLLFFREWELSTLRSSVYMALDNLEYYLSNKCQKSTDGIKQGLEFLNGLINTYFSRLYSFLELLDPAARLFNGITVIPAIENLLLSNQDYCEKHHNMPAPGKTIPIYKVIADELVWMDESFLSQMTCYDFESISEDITYICNTLYAIQENLSGSFGKENLRRARENVDALFNYI